MPAPAPASDRVVCEVPVFLSPALASTLTLVDYPLTSSSSASPLELSSVRVKRGCNLLSMSMSFPGSEEHLDQGKLSRWDDLSALEFRSCHVPAVCNYAVGKMVGEGAGRELHLVPLGSAYQMRPSFPFIEKEDQESAGGEPALAAAAPPPEPAADDADNGLRAIQLKKKESERTATAKKNTFAYKRSEEAKEPWANLRIPKGGSAAARRYDSQFLCPAPAKAAPVPLAPSSAAGYVSSLSYLSELRSRLSEEFAERFDGREERVTSREGAVSKVVRSFYARDAPVNAAVLLCSVMASDPGLLLEALEMCALLVQGNWVLKST